MKLEICCYGIEDAILAQEYGADRIELCSGRSDGGLTPSFGELSQIAQLPFSIPIHPIVRPRGGDFSYTGSEINSMILDIELIKNLNFKGVVIGALSNDGSIDIVNMKKMIEAAKGLSITFHRAFDVCKDPALALQQLCDLGVDRVLTSGQQNTAVAGIELIKKLAASNQQIKIMPGCGVRANNIKLFIDAGLTEIHSSASKTIPSPMKYRNTNVSMSNSANDEFVLYKTDSCEIAEMKKQMMMKTY